MHATSLQTNLLLESGIFLVFTNHLHIRIDFADGKAEHHHNNAENHGDNARNDDKCSRRFKRIDKKQNAEQKAQDGAENEKTSINHDVSCTKNHQKHESANDDRP